jgi:hypothetical protein
VVEQSGAILHAQDPPHRVVEARHRDSALAEELLAIVADVGADHLRVGAGHQGRGPGAGTVSGDAVAARAAVGLHGWAGA